MPTRQTIARRIVKERKGMHEKRTRVGQALFMCSSLFYLNPFSFTAFVKDNISALRITRTRTDSKADWSAIKLTAKECRDPTVAQSLG